MTEGVDTWEHRRTHDEGLSPPLERGSFVRVNSGDGGSAELICGDSVALEPTRWLWHGFLPLGMLTVFGGAPGAGKTTLALDIAARATSGAPWPDGTRNTDCGDAVFWSGEDVPSVLVGRLIACGGNKSRFHILAGDGRGGAIDWQRDERRIEAALANLERPRLLIIDPASQIMTGDMHRANEVRMSLAPLVRLAQRFDLAALAVTHFGKSTQGKEPTERLLGSGAYGAMARVVAVATKNAAAMGTPHDRLFARSKSNIGPDDGGFQYALERIQIAPGIDGQRVKWGAKVEGDARTLLAAAEAVDASESDAGDPDSELVGLLRACLASGQRSVGEVFSEMDAAGFSKWQVKRAKAKAGIVSVKQTLSGGWLWRLAEGSGRPDTLNPSHPSHPSQPFDDLAHPSGFPPFSEGGGGHMP